MNRYQEAIETARRTGEPVERGGFTVYPTIDTTMRVNDEAISKGKPDGYMSIALEQTKGIGSTDPRTGENRTWRSGEGNLMSSRIVQIVPDQEHPQEIEMIAALAVGEVTRDLLNGSGKKVEWKYPNDVLVNGAKISGALAHLSSHPVYTHMVNLGVGVNIAATPAAKFMREKSAVTRATCLHECDLPRIALADFLELFEARFERTLQEYRSTRRFEDILERMGFTEPGTGLMTVCDASGEHLTGFYAGFTTRLNENGIPVNYLRLNDQKAAQEFPVRDLHIVTREKPQPISRPCIGAPQNG